MTITKLLIGSPRRGGVFFSDGAAYDWFLHRLSGEVFFTTYRYQGGSSIPYSFRSAKRAALLMAKLGTENA